MKRFIPIFLSLVLWSTFFIPETQAQNETSFKPGVDIMSRYVWRGLNLGGSSPSIQPSLEYTINNFTIGTWGAFSSSNGFEVQETDLYLSYSFKESFSVTLTDYFFPNETIGNNHYFDFEEDSTGHLFEIAAAYLGSERIPFSFMAAVNFWGADARNLENKKQYSTYFELGYNGSCKEIDYNIFIGGTPNSPDKEKGETGFYGPSAGVINIGITAIKNVEITDRFKLPVSTSFIINPQTENVFLVLGISL